LSIWFVGVPFLCAALRLPPAVIVAIGLLFPVAVIVSYTKPMRAEYPGLVGRIGEVQGERLTLRPVQPTDLDFIDELTDGEFLGENGWTADQRSDLLAEVRRLPSTLAREFAIVLVESGLPVGTITVED